MKPVAILGSGPAGLMAAQAAALCGAPIVIISDAKKSELGGAQFLHAPLPAIHAANVPEMTVTYVRRGDPQNYRKKAFDDLPVPWVDWNTNSPEQRPAWRLEETYQCLWDLFQKNIEMNQETVSTQWIKEHQDQFFHVFSSIPLNRLCECLPNNWDRTNTHSFYTQRVKISPEGFENNIEDNTVVLDGTDLKSWYRSSKINGREYTEWGSHCKTPPGLSTFNDFKPIRTDCTCIRSPNVSCVGRRGAWDVKKLSHDAFYDAMRVLGSRLGERKI